MKLEICCADIESVMAAKAGGADRIELCSSLETGGLTPSVGLIRETVEIMGGEKVNVLIRPRGGDFVYSPLELTVMIRDIEAAIECGAQGIVTGSLTPEGFTLLSPFWELRRRYPSVTFTFHRAFDLTPDPFNTLEEIIRSGFDRILTSGQASDALVGAPLINRLVQRAAGRIDIMAGCGVTPANIRDIIRISGVKDIHASAKTAITSPRKNRDVRMGTDAGADGIRYVTDAFTVAKLKELIS